MAYDASKPFTYGIKDGDYIGVPTTAAFFEKDGRLILDLKFAVKDPATGNFYKKDNGYEWEAMKRHWITSKDGGFNEATINGIKEWAKGWSCDDLSSFYWFQQPDANGRPFGNLAAIGEVSLSFQTDRNTGAQNLWVHDINRQQGAGRKAFVPDGAVTDPSALAAKWGAKAKALFASKPRKLGAAAATTAPAAPAAPTPAAVPSRPAAPVEAPSRAPAQEGVNFPQTVDGAFAYFCTKLNEPYNDKKHADRWFALCDKVTPGKDPDQLTPTDIQNLMSEIALIGC